MKLINAECLEKVSGNVGELRETKSIHQCVSAACWFQHRHHEVKPSILARFQRREADDGQKQTTRHSDSVNRPKETV